MTRTFKPKCVKICPKCVQKWLNFEEFFSKSAFIAFLLQNIVGHFELKCVHYTYCVHIWSLWLYQGACTCASKPKRESEGGWCSTYTTCYASAILRHLILCRPFFISCFLLKKFAQLLFFVTPRPLIPHNTLNIFSPIQFFSLIPSLLSPIESSSFIIIYFSVIICIIPPI